MRPGGPPVPRCLGVFTAVTITAAGADYNPGATCRGQRESNRLWPADRSPDAESETELKPPTVEQPYLPYARFAASTKQWVEYVSKKYPT